MNRNSRFFSMKPLIVGGLAVICAVPAGIAAVNGQFPYFRNFLPNGIFYPNPNGASQTYSANGGGIDLTGTFFQSLGTNGRNCGTCHEPNALQPDAYVAAGVGSDRLPQLFVAEET